MRCMRLVLKAEGRELVSMKRYDINLIFSGRRTFDFLGIKYPKVEVN